MAERKSKDERRAERQRRRESLKTRRATLASGGSEARREFFWGNLMRQRRARGLG